MAEVAQPETAAEVEDDAKTSDALGESSSWATIAKLARVVGTQDRHAAITRRLALVALRLAVIGAGAYNLERQTYALPGFGVLVKWANLAYDAEITEALNAAIDEAVAALREAGEVSE